MGPQDGVDYALRALAHLRDELGRDDVHAAFIGGGDAFDDMVALSRELGLDDIVRVHRAGAGRDRPGLPVHRRRLPGARPAEPAQRRLDDEQDRRVHGDGPADRLVRPARGARLGRRRRASTRRPTTRRAFAAPHRASCSTTPAARERMGAIGRRRCRRRCPGRPHASACSRPTRTRSRADRAARPDRARGSSAASAPRARQSSISMNVISLRGAGHQQHVVAGQRLHRARPQRRRGPSGPRDLGGGAGRTAPSRGL